MDVAMNRILSFAVAALLLSGCASVVMQAPKSCLHQNESSETDIGYCQAIRSGNTLYISGTAGKGDMPSAVRSVYGRLKETLEAHGLTFADVVKENVFATDLDSFIDNKELRKECYGKSFPAATWVQVERLYVPSLVVEIELTAVFSK